MPPKRRSLDDVLRTAEGVLRASRVEHVFVGGVTVLAFGIPRTTTDVDVIAAIEARQIPKIVSGLPEVGVLRLRPGPPRRAHGGRAREGPGQAIDLSDRPRAGLHSSSSRDLQDP